MLLGPCGARTTKGHTQWCLEALELHIVVLRVLCSIRETSAFNQWVWVFWVCEMGVNPRPSLKLNYFPRALMSAAHVCSWGLPGRRPFPNHNAILAGTLGVSCSDWVCYLGALFLPKYCPYMFGDRQ